MALIYIYNQIVNERGVCGNVVFTTLRATIQFMVSVFSWKKVEACFLIINWVDVLARNKKYTSTNIQ